MLNLEIDIETFSSVNLAKAGVYRYAESPDFEVLLFGYSVDGGEVKVGEDNKMVNRISIKNVQDLCTALEVSYQLDDKRKREKDALIEELKKNIKNTIAEFTKAHNEIDVNKETTMSSAFQYLDYTLKQKILTLYNENSDIVDEIVSKYSLPLAI